MTPQQIALVKTTWCQAVPMADTVSALFYDRLFEIDSGTRRLFGGTDMEIQRKKLIQAVAMVVGALDMIEEIIPIIKDLGRRHATYGVMDLHYETVGAALLWTLEKGLGDSWTPDVKEAWTTAFTAIANIMRSAAADQEALERAGHTRSMVASNRTPLL